MKIKRLMGYELLNAITTPGAQPLSVLPRAVLESPFGMLSRVDLLLSAPVKTRFVRTTQDALQILDGFRAKMQEHIICLSVGSGEKLLACRVVSIGTLSSAVAHPREVFADPIADRAHAVIIAHNHPSGDAQASNQDITLTQQLVAAGQILGIELRDHLILTEKSYFSFREGNYLL